MTVNHIKTKTVEGLGTLFRAFKYRNYRLFFAGQGISLIGTWMQGTAMGWMVFRITGSEMLLGVVGFCAQIPAFFLAPVAGVLADRHSRRNILIVTQLLSMIQALTLAALVLTGTINSDRWWPVIALSLFMGLINAFDVPTRQSFVVELVHRREDLGNAIALNSTMFNSARFIGPWIAGQLMLWFRASPLKEGPCFLINALSYPAVLFSLAAMKLKRKRPDLPRKHILHDLREGFHYVTTHRPIRSVLLNIALVSLVGAPYYVLMPVFAKKILEGNEATMGYLISAIGLGALSGALFLASRKNVLGMAGRIPVATAIFGVGLIAFSRSQTLWLSLPCLVVSGFGMMVQMAASNTVLQTVTQDRMRGRVMSFYTISLMGMMPFGSLLAGGLATGIGASWTVTICGGACLVGALMFTRKVRALNDLIAQAHPQPQTVKESLAEMDGPDSPSTPVSQATIKEAVEEETDDGSEPREK